MVERVTATRTRLHALQLSCFKWWDDYREPGPTRLQVVPGLCVGYGASRTPQSSLKSVQGRNGALNPKPIIYPELSATTPT